MQPKSTSHVIQGMQKDTSKSKLSNKFAFDAKNIRVTAIDDNSLLSITNEKGNKYTAKIQGAFLGHCVLKDSIVVFSSGIDDKNKRKTDYITLYNYSLTPTELVKTDINFSSNSSIEALGVYENETVYKVYWVDGVNPPRVINVRAPEEIRKKWTSSSFDFVPELTLQESISVEYTNASSMFAPGVIQYAFSYYNKYGQESNIFNVTPLCYIAHAERGASPEEIVKNTSFKITINNVDTNFEYIRIYSIHRTSLDAIPTVKKIIDLPISGKVSTYIDNGILGENIDPTQLLYIGGEHIIAGTITQKDNTLFLGNVTLAKNNIPSSVKYFFETAADLITETEKFVNVKDEKYTAQETYRINDYSYFRAGEIYRLGVQFQYHNGKWSEPIYIKDITKGNSRPIKIKGQNFYKLPIFSLNINNITDDIKNELKALKIKKWRGVVVYPENTDRKIIAQGILCPTVFNVENRSKNNPYAQSSWLLRPFINRDFSNSTIEDYNNSLNIEDGAVVEFRHNKSLITGANRGSEIQNNTLHKVDQSILTFYSPDVEFDEGLPYENAKLQIVGITPFSSNHGDIEIKIDKPYETTFNKYPVINNNSGSTGLISGTFCKALYVWPRPAPVDYNKYEYGLIYMWQKTGELRPVNSTDSEYTNQHSTLLTKKISNIKISTENQWFESQQIWKALGGIKGAGSVANGISKIEKFNSNKINLLKIKPFSGDAINYFGCIDTLLSHEDPYNIFYSDKYDDNNFKSATNGSKDVLKYDPVRMKYKSCPHLVFSLNKSQGDNHTIILPTLNNMNSLNDTTVEEDLVLPDDRHIEYIDYRFDSNLGNALPNYIKDGDIIAMPNYHNPNILEFYIYTDALGLRLYQPEEEVWLYYRVLGTNNIDVYEPTAGNYNTKTWRYYTTINDSPSSGDGNIKIKQDSIYYDRMLVPSAYLYLAELYKDVNSDTAFGGKTEEAIKTNLWLPAGPSVSIDNSVVYAYGDTRYQRYDCLKTYAFTPEDENQVVEIASFMCETRVNMLGRYDRNIGNLSNLEADYSNFNLFNPIYSQKDNFFNYRIIDEDLSKLKEFPNIITWSKEKHLGEEIDTWTNITMASTLNLDGTKGKLNKLVTFKDNIFAFQDKGISKILFNSRVQIPVSDGVPIEISNNMKVNGSIYISDIIGCQNKNSIATTPSGVYFLDSETNSIYLLADGITNLSNDKGFSIWTKEVARDSSFRTFYDKNNQDVYFTTENYCLGYSEKLGQFVSFYDYNDVDLMFNLYNEFYSIKHGGIYRHHTGEYNMFYGEYKPYSITIISNDNPYTDKIFNTVEYRADLISKEEGYRCESPFDTLEVWNEYQKGETSLVFNRYSPSSLKKKFRMWRANIPRDCKNKLDRMRNPWLYIKLSNNNNLLGGKMELHDIMVHYFE